jgi:hypothetical protein
MANNKDLKITKKDIPEGLLTGKCKKYQIKVSSSKEFRDLKVEFNNLLSRVYLTGKIDGMKIFQEIDKKYIKGGEVKNDRKI